MRVERREDAGSHTGRFEPSPANADSSPNAGEQVRNDRMIPLDSFHFSNKCPSTAYANPRISDIAAAYSADFLRSVLDLVPTGLVVIDEQHRVELINYAAEIIIRRGDTLRIGGDKRVHAVESADRKGLTGFLQAIFQSHPIAASDATAKHLFARGGRPVLAVTAFPLRGATPSDSNPISRALLSLEFLGVDRKLSVDILRALYGLTPAEAQLACALAIGKTLTECSINRNVSINTIKTQLNAILTKTGLHRQVDLVRLLVAI